MKPFLGLFAHWDVVTRQEPPKFLGKYFSAKSDSEIFIAKNLHSRISSSLSNPQRIIGGNAANAAVALSELDIPCVLSCPARPKNLMAELSKHRIFLMSGGRETSTLRCARPEEEPEHMIFERECYRKIFNYDTVERSFLLDQDFWDSIGDASYMFLSGFQTIPERQKKKVKEIADLLEKRRFKVHLELGYGKNLMKYAIKKLVERNCIDSIGMNETELPILGIKERAPKETAESMVLFMAENGLERMSLHTREYRISVFRKDSERNEKAAELSIQACAAKALGGIRENMRKAGTAPFSRVRPLKGEDFFIIPTRIVEKPKIIVGLGDAAAVTDSFYAMKKSV